MALSVALIILAILVLGLILLMAITAGFAVYYDAKMLGREDGTLWGVLTGLSGLIAFTGIGVIGTVIVSCIYLCIRGRRKGLGVCHNCSAQYSGLDLCKKQPHTCQKCGSLLELYQAPVFSYDEENFRRAKKASKLLAAVGVLACIAVPLVLLLAVAGIFSYAF